MKKMTQELKQMETSRYHLRLDIDAAALERHWRVRAGIAAIVAFLIVFVPRVHGEKKMVKFLNEQLGKTVDQLEHGWGGPGHLWIPDEGEWKGKVIFLVIDK